MIQLDVKPERPKDWKNNLFARMGKGMPEATKRQLGQAAGVVEREVKLSVKDKLPKADELIRSYHIRPRIQVYKAQPYGGMVDLRVTSTLAYARVQDQGTGYLPGRAILPRTTPKRKALAIPLKRELKRAGVWPRHNSARLKIGPRSRRGNALLVNADTGEPLYVLVPRVKLKPTNYLRQALKNGKPAIRRIMRGSFRQAVGKSRRRR